MQETETGYSLSKLKGNLGQTAFDGKLDIDLSGDKPAIFASLVVPVVDAGPLQAISARGSQPDDNQNVTASAAELPELNQVDLSLAILNEFDADIELQLEQVINAPGDIRNAALKVGIHDGALVAPMQVTFADVAFHGNLDLNNYHSTPGFLLSLSARQTDLGNLAMVFTDTEGVEGHLKSFEFHPLKTYRQNLEHPSEDWLFRLFWTFPLIL